MKKNYYNEIIGIKRIKLRSLCFLAFICLAISQLNAQTAPFQMPSNNNEGAIYDNIDFYNFSTVAFDSQNRPYGFNMHEEFGYVRTLRNGVWVEINYLDDLQAHHPGLSITSRALTNGHHPARISITSDDHLYITMEYNTSGDDYWAILYLDDLDSDDFQIRTYPRATTPVVNVEEFTGHNLKNGETPAILVTEVGASLEELGWPAPTVSWSTGIVHVIKLVIPYRNSNGTLSFNTTLVGTKLGATTIHSGGDATMATIGNKTYFTYSGFDEARIENEGARDNVNWGYLAEATRPSSASGNTTFTSRFMGVQSVYGHIDSHSQGGVVLDATGRLHYLPGNHAEEDEYWRTTRDVNDPSFNFSTDWTQYGTTTNDGDFSYDTPVIDDNNTIHVAYRQRNGGANRGLYVKTGSVNTTNWGTNLGSLIVRPPAPWSSDGQYIIHYHRLVMDRASNVHLSSGFFEFGSGENGEYPRINAYRPNGNGAWEMPDRYTYLENIINGKTVQQLSFSIGNQSLENSPITLNGTDNSTGLPISYEIVSGPATISGNSLTLTGTGEVTIKAGNSGNSTYYGDEVTQKFQVIDGSQVFAEADAYVRDGGSANTNFGNDTGLVVKNDNTGFNRQAYFRFDLSGVSGTINSAKLRLVPSGSGTGVGSTTIQTKFVSDDSWSEAGITWNNKPTGGSVLSGQTGSANPTEWDITSQVQTEQSGDGKLSLLLESTVAGSPIFVTYNSREASNSSVRPVLIIDVGQSPPPPPPTGDTVDISAEADTYVRSGVHGNTNFGTDASLIIKKSNTGDSYNREAYYRFDLSSVSGTITDAKLRLVPSGNSSNVGAASIEVKFVGDDSWSETGTTWNNKPSTGSVLATQSGSASTMEWDVTSQVQTENSGDGKFSVNINAAVNNGQWIHYHSREASNTSLRPVLVVTTSSQSTVTSSISSSADSYIRSGSYGNDNYGNDTALIVKRSNTGDSYSREAYYRFDLSTVSGTITEAKLKLVPSGSSGNVGAIGVDVKFVSDDSWNETGITWNNRPTAGSVVSSQAGSASATEWDVTSQAQTEKSGDGQLSLNISATINNGQWVHYYSKEASNSADRPVLVVTTTGGGASNLSMISEDVAVAELPEIEVQDSTTVHPNPFINWIRIASPNGIRGYRLYSTTGMLLLSMDNIRDNEAEVDTASLTKGVYILKVLGSDGSVSDFKIVK
ncbi:DNRLRE domain-containing protein [Maribacter sp. 2304DJ31-5]|uniref:CBM96 family carbohydrate-binding protein n=1 Tax=Maribacter sp. 2304DJ31-5 TaxID=3386273 RepID=UPI0039BD6438